MTVGMRCQHTACGRSGECRLGARMIDVGYERRVESGNGGKAIGTMG
ncbi:hypothetical protein C27AD_11661 [Salinisphaera hydrothermalis C27AD]